MNNIGILSCLPPIACIVCALFTKEVLFSLFVGIITGSLIYSAFYHTGIVGFFKIIFDTMTKSINENTLIIVFIMILGALIYVINLAGGANAYRNFVIKKIKSKRMAMVLTAILGVLIMIDDYFNALTVGMVMRPIIDKHKIPRAKFACIIDFIASPICVLVPISSWAASIISCYNNSELSGSDVFFKAIPYNFYPILAIIFAFFMATEFFDDFGKLGKISSQESTDNNPDKFKSVNTNGKIYDLIFPIAVLITISILVINKTKDTVFGITIGSIVALITAFFMFVFRKLIPFHEFMHGIIDGMNLMLSAVVTLVLAWTLSDLTKDQLGTGNFIAEIMSKINMSENFMPAIIFLFSGVLAYSIGSSWGTFAILIPVTCAICQNFNVEILLYSLAGVTSGAVAGVNCSPISNTMIMVSEAAGCDHMEHAFCQLPYASCIAGSAFLGFFVIGITYNIFIAFFSSFFLLIILSKFFGIKNKHKNENLT